MAQQERNTRPTCTQRLLEVLNKRTPLATVLQDVVASYLEGATLLFVCDMVASVVRAVNLEDFVVTTLAGQPETTGWKDGRGKNALFKMPFFVTVDKATDTLLVGHDSGIRRVTTDGVVSTLWSNISLVEGRNPCAYANFKEIAGLCVVGSTLFACDCNNHCIYRIALDSSGHFEVFAGLPGKAGFADGEQAKFFCPNGIAADAAGNLFIADSENHCIRKVTPSGVVSTVAGKHSKEGLREGPFATALFNNPSDVAFDWHGRLLVVDYSNDAIRVVDFERGLVSSWFQGPPLQSPCALAVDIATHTVFVTCRTTILCVSSNSTVNTVCGQLECSKCKDGKGTEATFSSPAGLALL